MGGWIVRSVASLEIGGRVGRCKSDSHPDLHRSGNAIKLKKEVLVIWHKIMSIPLCQSVFPSQSQ